MCFLSVGVYLVWNEWFEGVNDFGYREGNVSCASFEDLVIDVDTNV